MTDLIFWLIYLLCMYIQYTILYKVAGLQKLSILDVSPPTQGIPLICASTYVPVNYITVYFVGILLHMNLL